MIITNKVLVYTYGLSPFRALAVALLEASGYEFSKIELGAEWFVLGGEASETRAALSNLAQDGATSFPKKFIGGKCIGGCAELASLVESGELEVVMKQSVPLKGTEKEYGWKPWRAFPLQMLIFSRRNCSPQAWTNLQASMSIPIYYERVLCIFHWPF